MHKYWANKAFRYVVDWVKSSLTVNTIDSFQGQEAEFVFISLAKSGKGARSGFANDQKRANVLFSRSSQFMCIFGNALTMTDGKSAVESNNLLPAMAHYASQNNAMFTVDTDASGADLIPYTLGMERLQRPRIRLQNELVYQTAAVTSPSLSRAGSLLDPGFINYITRLLEGKLNGLSLSEKGTMIPAHEKKRGKSLLFT